MKDREHAWNVGGKKHNFYSVLSGQKHVARNDISYNVSK